MRVWKLNSALHVQRVCLCLIISEAHVTEKLRGTTWTQNPVSSEPMRSTRHVKCCTRFVVVYRLMTEQKYKANLCSEETCRS